MVVRALTEDDLAGRTLKITGPELLTFAEVAAALSAATDRPIGYAPCSVDEFTSAAAEEGLPEPEARVLAEVFAQVFDGRNAHLTQDLADVLGRPGRRFADDARRTAATGVWDEHATMSAAPSAPGQS